MKTLAVHQLREGDKFEFLNEGRPATVDEKFGRRGGVMIVTRAPRVNAAANSCFFRYRGVDEMPLENHSWNGMADSLVSVIGIEPATATGAKPAASTAETPTPRHAPTAQDRSKTAPAKRTAAIKTKMPPAKRAAAKKSAKPAPQSAAKGAAKPVKKKSAAKAAPAKPRATARRIKKKPAKR